MKKEILEMVREQRSIVEEERAKYLSGLSKTQYDSGYFVGMLGMCDIIIEKIDQMPTL